MPSSKCLDILNSGVEEWNNWRNTDEGRDVDLSDIDFVSDCPKVEGFYNLPEFNHYNFSGLYINRASLRNGMFINCDFSDSNLYSSDLVDSYCQKCDFSRAKLRVSRIGSAVFEDCDFSNADLSYCSAEETSFKGSTLAGTNLSNMSLVKTDFSNTQIDGACAYGVSVWDINLKGCKQGNITISESDGSITVPNIELAQFIALLLNSKKLRQVIETITSKVVLILGRFTPERKKILDKIKTHLEKHGYLAVIFDFQAPANRDITETVLILATLSKFIVADLTDPRSIPQELTAIIPQLPSVPVQPIIETKNREYGMFEHFKSYQWVLPTINYVSSNLPDLVDQVVGKCEEYLKS